MQTIKYLVSDARFAELESAVKYKGISLESAYTEIAVPYLNHCRRMRHEREYGSDPKLVKRMQKQHARKK